MKPANNESTADQAIAYMEANKVSAYAAAKHFGISPTAVYRRIEWRKQKDLCPCCGQVIPKKSNPPA